MTSAETGPIAAALAAAQVFEHLGIPYCITGSVASTIHGESRATNDVDFVVQLKREQSDDLVRAFAQDFLLDPYALSEALRGLGFFNAIHRASMTKVDVYVRPAEGFDRLQVERAQRLHLGSDPWDCARVATAEDMIVQKLSWFRRGGEVSDRQWRDVLGMLKQGGRSLDFGHLRTWCRQLGVDDLLRRALTESGLGDAAPSDQPDR